MKLLLDTHILIWASGPFPQLSRAAAALIDDPQNIVLFSAASLWEIAIKAGMGRGFHVDPRIFRENMLRAGYEELPVRSEHAIAIADLPPLHKDPFDRILIAQAHVEGVTLMTSDAIVARYPGAIRKI